MPQAVFACYICRHVFGLSDSHHCQKECLPITGMHHDICTGCRTKMLDSFTAQTKQGEKP
jgi:hypothetical protein